MPPRGPAPMRGARSPLLRRNPLLHHDYGHAGSPYVDESSIVPGSYGSSGEPLAVRNPRPFENSLRSLASTLAVVVGAFMIRSQSAMRSARANGTFLKLPKPFELVI